MTEREMTVQEIQEELRKTEREISDALEQFKKKTGLYPSYHDRIGCGGDSVVAVLLKVVL